MNFTYDTNFVPCPKTNGKNPTVEIKQLQENEEWSFKTNNDELIFILKGKLNSNYHTTSITPLSKGKILLLTSHYQFKSYARKKTEVLIFRIQGHFQLCECMSPQKIYNRSLNEFPRIANERTYLDIKPAIWKYLNTLIFCIEEGFTCSSFYEAKLKEFYYYVRKYYSLDEIYNFFSPLLYFNARFHDFILSNHHKVKNVRELAESMNYSVSGFEKHFKKVFNISPGKWMKMMRSDAVFRDIKFSLKSFKQISEDFGFFSPSHLNNFCKMHFGKTPGELREENSNTP